MKMQIIESMLSYSNGFEKTECVGKKLKNIAPNVSGLCVVALSRNLKLTTTLDRAITQNPCYVPFLFRL
jgi:hypothetical protein